jgi:hypothetical protein
VQRLQDRTLASAIRAEQQGDRLQVDDLRDVYRNMSDAYDDADRAFAALTELFSKPIKYPQPHRRYDLTFENGEPVWTQNEIDRIFDEVIEELYGPKPVE